MEINDTFLFGFFIILFYLSIRVYFRYSASQSDKRMTQCKLTLLHIITPLLNLMHMLWQRKKMKDVAS